MGAGSTLFVYLRVAVDSLSRAMYLRGLSWGSCSDADFKLHLAASGKKHPPRTNRHTHVFPQVVDSRLFACRHAWPSWGSGKLEQRTCRTGMQPETRYIG